VGGFIWGQIASQLAWTLGLSAAPFLALGLGRPDEVGIGVVLVQLLRLAPLLAGGLAARPGLALAGANFAAASLLPVSALGGWPVLAYGVVGLVGVLEGWLGPVSLHARLGGPALEKANGLLVALQVVVPALFWPLAGRAVGMWGPAPVLQVAAALFGLRALALLPWRGLSAGTAPGLPWARGLVFGLPLFFLLLPLGALAVQLPPLLGPTGYGFYNQLFALGTASGALLGGRRRLGLVVGAVLVVTAGPLFLAGGYLAGGLVYGLGLGAVQVAGLGLLGRWFGEGAFAGVLAGASAAGALGGAAGALLSAWPPAVMAPLIGLLLGPFSLRWGRLP